MFPKRLLFLFLFLRLQPWVISYPLKRRVSRTTRVGGNLELTGLWCFIVLVYVHLAFVGVFVFFMNVDVVGALDVFFISEFVVCDWGVNNVLFFSCPCSSLVTLYVFGLFGSLWLGARRDTIRVTIAILG